MYKFTFSNEQEEDLKKKNSSAQEVLSSFQSVDDKYANTNREVNTSSPSYEKLTYEKPTDEEIKNKATNSLYEYKTSSQKKIDDDISVKKSELEKQEKLVSESAQEDKDELQTLYGSLKKNFSEDAIKRGLARSSIVVNKLEAFDRSMLDNYLKLDKELNEKITELNSEKSILEVQRQNALSSFDIAYAVKLEEKISELSAEVNEEEQKVIKYNNDIAEKEAEYELEQETLKNKVIREDRQDNQDYLEYISENGTSALEDAKAKEKFEIAYEYFMTQPRIEALNELVNNTDYRKHLGRYFEKLHQLMMDRNN